MNFKEFKAVRLQKGHTQQSLATVLGLAKSSISKKERGLIKFTVNEIMVLKNLLGLSVEEVDRIFFSE
jgi:DNA-binding XRE family transcriptional regulator